MSLLLEINLTVEQLNTLVQLGKDISAFRLCRLWLTFRTVFQNLTKTHSHLGSVNRIQLSATCLIIFVENTALNFSTITCRLIN